MAELPAPLSAVLAAFACSPIGVGIVGSDGRWLGGNRTLCEIVGCQGADLGTRTLEALLQADEGGRGLEQPRRLLAGETDCFQQGGRLLLPDGRVRALRLTGSRVPGPGGDPLFVIQVEDVSGHPTSAPEAQVIEDARRAIRTRDDVLRILAHDLRNPLNTIALSTGLLLRRTPPGPSEARGQLDFMRRAVERADLLISDLLDVVQLETGTLRLERRPEALPPLLETAVAAQRAHLGNRACDVQVRAAADLPPVLGDAGRLLRVLGVLIGGAMERAGPEGVVMLRAECAGAEVQVSVTERRLSVPAKAPARLAPRYTFGREGGLSAALAAALTEAHGGVLRVESTDTGVTTTLALPAHLGAGGATAR